MAQTDPITTALQHALDHGALPPERRAMGRQLITQLTQAPRIAVLGLTGAGKTAVINMLLGDRLMPDQHVAPLVELTYAPLAGFDLEYADGAVSSYAGLVTDYEIPQGTRRVSQSLPDARLQEFSFLELTLTGSHPGEASLLASLSSRCDIVLMCSQRFDDRERALWAGLPDHLKDHSFLVLTKADQLFLKQELAPRIAQLQPVVADEFLALYPLATMQAQAARGQALAAARGAASDDGLWQSSGGKAFFQRLCDQVDQARMAGLDQAQMLLDRYPKPVPLRPVAPPTVASPAAPMPRAKASPQPDQGPAIDRALDLLQRCASDLLHADQPGQTDADAILDRCSAVASDLTALLADPTDARLTDLHDDAVQAEHMVMLLRLDRGVDASTDALTILVQLKKHLSERAVQ